MVSGILEKTLLIVIRIFASKKMRSKHAVARDDWGITARRLSMLGTITSFDCSSSLHSQALLVYHKFSGKCSGDPNKR